jgi:hypothetical protein
MMHGQKNIKILLILFLGSSNPNSCNDNINTTGCTFNLFLSTADVTGDLSHRKPASAGNLFAFLLPQFRLSGMTSCEAAAQNFWLPTR